MSVTCPKDFSITIFPLTPAPCGFWEACSIDRGNRVLTGVVGDTESWTGLPEGEYQLVFVDHVYQGHAVPPNDWWIMNIPPPGGVNAINYADNGVFSLTGLPTQPVGFADDATASADYHSYPMPTFSQDLPLNTNSITIAFAGPGPGPLVGTPTFNVTQTQQLIQAEPAALSAVSSIASFAASRVVLTYGGSSTPPLAVDALAATVQTALNALAPIAADGGVVCAGVLASGMTITWNNNGNRAEITTAITTVSPAYYADVVATQNGTAGLPEIQTLTVATWCPYLVPFAAQPNWNGAISNRNLWDIATFQHWYIARIASYSYNPPPFQVQDLGLLDVTVRNVCGPDAPLTAPTAVAGGAGNVNAGSHTWSVVFVRAVVAPLSNAESGASPSATLNLAVNSQVNLSNVPLGPAGTTARNIYRTVLGQTIPRLVGSIPDNVTTVFTDNVADATLAFANPVQPGSHFWEIVFAVVADPFSFGPPYGFYDFLWRGYKTTGNTPEGRYLPWAPRVQFDATQYHSDVTDGIPYFDLT